MILTLMHGQSSGCVVFFLLDFCFAYRICAVTMLGDNLPKNVLSSDCLHVENCGQLIDDTRGFTKQTPY